jgi:hypothetical protein
VVKDFGTIMINERKVHFMERQLRIKENQLLFDINNPNCSIITDINEIANMLKDVPVFHSEPHGERVNPEPIVGVVNTVTKITNTQIFGSIWFFNEHDFSDMWNYSMQVDVKNTEPIVVDVLGVDGIMVKLK